MDKPWKRDKEMGELIALEEGRTCWANGIIGSSSELGAARLRPAVRSRHK
jgi:hypothetical protein